MTMCCAAAILVVFGEAREDVVHDVVYCILTSMESAKQQRLTAKIF